MRPVILPGAALLPAAWREAAADGPCRCFNPGLLAEGEGWILAYRVVLGDDRRRIALCRLDAAFQPLPGSAVPFSDALDVATWHADPRLFRHQGRIWLHWNTGAERPHNRQYLSPVDPATLLPAGPPLELAIAEPRQPVEKNWGFFEAGGDLYCAYALRPSRVLRVRLQDGAGVTLCEPLDPPSAGIPGEPLDAAWRGGAPPVDIGEGFLVVGHRPEPMQGGIDYVATLCRFPAASPFAPDAALPDALTLPNPFGAQTTWPRLNPAVRQVAYPCGAALRDGRLVVSYGLNDEHCAIASLPLAPLLALMQPFPEPVPALPGSWLDDPHWVEAGRWVVRLAGRCAHVLAPAPIAALSPRALPLEFAHLLPPEGVGLVLPKGDADALPLDWLRRLGTFRAVFADAVFVVLVAGDATGLPEAAPEHLGYLGEVTARILAGEPVRPSRIDRALTAEDATEGDYGILVTASQTRNAGDRLIAATALEVLRAASPALRWVVTGTEVDRSLVRGASRVVLGPGGMLYDVANGSADLDNLVAYLKFGLLAKEYGKRFDVFGVGHQGLRTAPGRRFAAAALRQAGTLAVRDSDTARLLEQELGLRCLTGPDVSLLALPQVPAPAAARTPPRIGIVGEFLAHPQVAAALLAGLPAAGGASLHCLLQSEEDAAWFGGQRAALRQADPAVGCHDLRDAAADAFIAAIAACDALVTTRFHGMLIGLMAGMPMLVFAQPGDKRRRALADLPAGMPRPDVLDPATCTGSEVAAAVTRLVGRAGRQATLAELKDLEAAWRRRWVDALATKVPSDPT